MKEPSHLIINNPYRMPDRHWKYDRQRQSFTLAEGRRPAGYVMATPGFSGHDDPGVFVEIKRVNQIRVTIKGVSKEEKEEATKWIGGLDRIHRTRGILTCFDLSATPFVPSGKKSSEEALYGWIVSDFGLNDAIESGLVKTPRVVVRDDALPDVRTYKSKLYHIYAATDEHGNRIRDDLNRDAEPHESLPQLVLNGYYLLGKDWLEAKKAWEKVGHPVPPAMISVVNRIETAARFKHAIDHADILRPELCKPERTLQIDSEAFRKAEAQEEAISLSDKSENGDEDGDDGAPARKLTKAQQAERLRRMVVFEAARKLFEEETPAWRGSADFLLGQLIQLVEQFIHSNRLAIKPELYMQSEIHRRVLLALSMSRVVQHVKTAVRESNTESRQLVLDENRPIRSTGDMRPWYTSRPCEPTKRSHISHCVYDGTWEAAEAHWLDHRDTAEMVAAWTRNEHLGFEIRYIYAGGVAKYRPDFLIRLHDGRVLVLEVKGRDTPRDEAKRQALTEWVQAVSADGRFGRWCNDVSFSPSDVLDILVRHALKGDMVKA